MAVGCMNLEFGEQIRLELKFLESSACTETGCAPWKSVDKEAEIMNWALEEPISSG